MTGFVSINLGKQKLPPSLHHGAVAIGNFDGMHRGHTAVLEETLQTASARTLPALMLTFSPHPRTFFDPQNPVKRITPGKLLEELCHSIGFDGIIYHPFTAEFAALSAREFVEKTLVQTLAVDHVITGHDFHFGRKRAGTPEFLKQSGKEYGFGVSLVPAYRDEDGEIISSSRIRTLLMQGAVEQANQLLGYAYRVRGKVEKGQQLGRTLGYPTANLKLEEDCPLSHGIYAAHAVLADGTVRKAVCSYGSRPTVDNGRPLFECHILDFTGDIYGQTLTVVVQSHIREELKFDSMDELVDQIREDEIQARQYLDPLPVDHGRWPIMANNKWQGG